MGHRPPPFDGGSPRQVTLTPHTTRCSAMHCAKTSALAIARAHRARYETHILFVLDQIPHPSYEGEVEART